MRRQRINPFIAASALAGLLLFAGPQAAFASEGCVALAAPSAAGLRVKSELEHGRVAVRGLAAEPSSRVSVLRRLADRSGCSVLVVVSADAGYAAVWATRADGSVRQQTLMRQTEETVASLALRVAEHVAAWRAAQRPTKPASVKRSTATTKPAERPRGGTISGVPAVAGRRGIGGAPGRSVVSPASKSVAAANTTAKPTLAKPTTASPTTAKPDHAKPASAKPNPGKATDTDRPAASTAANTLAVSPLRSERVRLALGAAFEGGDAMSGGVFLRAVGAWQPAALPAAVVVGLDLPVRSRLAVADVGEATSSTYVATVGLRRQLWRRGPVSTSVAGGLGVAWTTAEGLVEDGFSGFQRDLVSAVGWAGASLKVRWTRRVCTLLQTNIVGLNPAPLLVMDEEEVGRSGVGLLRTSLLVEVSL